MKYGFYNPTTSDFVTNDYLIGGDIVYESNYVKQSDVKNNMLLIQSLIPINNYKFGGIRPSSPVKGDVYCSTNETGNITSVQQFNGVEWVSVVGSIYNDELGLWVNAVGFNIFLNNWTYQDVDYRADSSDMNVLIRFLTSMFNKITTALDSIIEKIKNINVDSTTITTTNNEFNVDINTDIHDLISNVNGYDSNIDLTDSNYQMTTNTLTDIKNLSTGFKAIFTTLDNNGFSLIYLIPIIILLVGLFL